MWTYTIEGKVIPSDAFTNSACLHLVFLGHLSCKNLANPPTTIPWVTASALIRECCTWEMLAEQRQTTSAGRRWLWNVTQLRSTIQRSSNYANTQNSVIPWLGSWLQETPAVRHAERGNEPPESHRCLCESHHFLLLCSISPTKSAKPEKVVCSVVFKSFIHKESDHLKLSLGILLLVLFSTAPGSLLCCQGMLLIFYMP